MRTTSEKRRRSGPRRRQMAAVGTLLTCAVVATAVPSSASAATTVSATDPTYQVDVVNYAGTDVKVRFFYGSGEHQGDVTSDDYGPAFGNAKKLPTGEAVTLGSGSLSPVFGYQTAKGSYDNGYWVEVTRGDDPNDRTVAKLYRWNPGEKPPGVTEQSGSGLKVQTMYEPKQNGFADDKTRIMITDARGQTDATWGDASWPYPGPWALDTRIGSDNGGWKNLDASSKQWQLTSLQPNADYWFRCYDENLSRLAFNGYFPKAAELGGGTANGKGQGFFVTSDENGRVSVLAPNGAPAQQSTCDVHAVTNTIEAKRITGTSTEFGVNERPIYKVDVQGATRVYEGRTPDKVRIPPYIVEGRDASGKWQKVGTVLPSGAPTAGDSTATHGGADFYFQNKPGQSFTHLRVAGGYGFTSNEIALAGLAAPGVSMNDIADLEVRAQSSTGRVTLEANGSAQEELDLRLFGQNGSIISESDPKAAAYDSVYFRDENGSLITGMYDVDGDNAVSKYRGSSINSSAGPAAAAAHEGTDAVDATDAANAVEKRRSYLSTTNSTAGLTWVTPNLDLDDHMEAADLTLRVVAPRQQMNGTLTTSMPISNSGGTVVSAAAPNAHALPQYRVDAVGGGAAQDPWSVGAVRYQALTPASGLPRGNIQSSQVAGLPMQVQAGILKLGPGADLSTIGDLTSMQVFTVSQHGTAVGPYNAPR